MAPDSKAPDAVWSGDDARGGRLLIGGLVAVCLHLALLGIRLDSPHPGSGRPGTAIEVSLMAAASAPEQAPVAPPASALPPPPPTVEPSPARPAARAKAPEPPPPEEITAERSPTRPVESTVAAPALPVPPVVEPPPATPVARAEAPEQAPPPEEITAAPTAERSPAGPVEPTAQAAPAPLAGATRSGAPVQHAARVPGSEGLISARPRYKTNPKPRYPPIARRRGQEGSVLLSVLVDASGKPMAIDIESSSGAEALDKAAVEAVERWQFEPGVREGEAVSSRVEVPIRFELD